MEDLTFAEQLVAEFRARPGGVMYGELFEILTTHGLKSHGSANSKTLLFIWHDAAGSPHNLIAFRRDPIKVVSLPKSFWPNHRLKFDDLRAPFNYATEMPPVGSGGGASAKESFAQFALTESTLARLKVLCNEACLYAKSSNG